MKPKISITFPSIHPESLRRELANVRARTSSTWEAIVVSPFEIKEPNVVWIKEKRPLGSAGAQWEAGKYASGEFITAFSDDRTAVAGWDQVAIKTFAEREKITKKSPFCLTLRQGVEHVGTAFGIHYSAFPFMRLADVKGIGGWYDPLFYSGYGDNDMGMRVWRAGGRVEWTDEQLLMLHADDRRGHPDIKPADMTNFIDRWRPTYGRGWPIKIIADFNIEVFPDAIPQYVMGNTIFANFPEFGALARGQGNQPPLLLESIPGLNLVAYRDAVYAIPRSLGPVDLANNDDLKKPGIVRFATVEAARAHRSRAVPPRPMVRA